MTETLTPGIDSTDATAAYWLGQTALRLRREAAWCSYWRGAGAEHPLPPSADAAGEVLDRARYEADRQRFFTENPAAREITDAIREPRPAVRGEPLRGCWDWLARAAGLDEAAEFCLALGVTAQVDFGAGPVIAAVMNDSSRPYPTIALGQRLWDEPLAVIACTDPCHPLFRLGLYTPSTDGSDPPWNRPLLVHPVLARHVMAPEGPLPACLEPLSENGSESRDMDLLAARLSATAVDRLQIVPLLGPRDADYRERAAHLSTCSGGHPVAVGGRLSESDFIALATLAWLRDLDFVFASSWPEQLAPEAWASARSVPARCFVPVTEAVQRDLFPPSAILPTLRIPPAGFAQRRALWFDALGPAAAGLEPVVEEAARRFRFEGDTIRRIAAGLARRPGLSGHDLVAACRFETVGRLGDLAQPVEPRFKPEELILPAAESRQYEEIIRAVRSLTTVHYHWGTARVWNEAGLSVLFSGPPGTGKTMAAEALARALELPMYRIDLSQVVNKYVGETEKNLKAIFDAAETSDCLLFFDEADALFGRRTEVKESLDRFANVEISYLLDRMERFKGVAVLATNRRKDLDEAFLRRLRYLVEFPMPGRDERERLWQDAFPEGVNIDALDIGYLARQFQLAGGHIRSIAFNACLQAAEQGEDRRVGMEHVLVAVKRELEKLKRAAGDEQFGLYRGLIREPGPVNNPAAARGRVFSGP